VLERDSFVQATRKTADEMLQLCEAARNHVYRLQQQGQVTACPNFGCLVLSQRTFGALTDCRFASPRSAFNGLIAGASVLRSGPPDGAVPPARSVKLSSCLVGKPWFGCANLLLLMGSVRPPTSAATVIAAALTCFKGGFPAVSSDAMPCLTPGFCSVLIDSFQCCDMQAT
jgi:hypothetical protein